MQGAVEGTGHLRATYRCGLCEGQYGIGAVAYFRRVVEERTNELIDVVADLAHANGTGDTEVQKILAAKSEKTYDKRLEVASQMLPVSLRPGGANPLGRLHDLLSVALHVKDEEGALKDSRGNALHPRALIYQSQGLY